MRQWSSGTRGHRVAAAPPPPPPPTHTHAHKQQQQVKGDPPHCAAAGDERRGRMSCGTGGQPLLCTRDRGGRGIGCGAVRTAFIDVNKLIQ